MGLSDPTEFILTGHGNLDLAIQSAQERADALGVAIRVVDERGRVVHVVGPALSQERGRVSVLDQPFDALEKSGMKGFR